jgi:hypothetical protein
MPGKESAPMLSLDDANLSPVLQAAKSLVTAIQDQLAFGCQPSDPVIVVQAHMRTSMAAFQLGQELNALGYTSSWDDLGPSDARKAHALGVILDVANADWNEFRPLTPEQLAQYAKKRAHESTAIAGSGAAPVVPSDLTPKKTIEGLHATLTPEQLAQYAKKLAHSISILDDSTDAAKEPDKSRADTKTDDVRQKWLDLPRNHKVIALGKRIKHNRNPKRSHIDIAREFTDCNETEAQSLLRKLRDFPHLKQ